MKFFPFDDLLNRLPVGGKSVQDWLESGHLSQAQFDALEYPWQLLDLHGSLLETLVAQACETPAQLDEGAALVVGDGTRILPGVYVEGVVVIGRNCKIGPNCFLRGPTSIGDNCIVGQGVELKNTIMGDFSNVGHLSYIGDSILGEKVNLGAGTITSNFRHDGGNHHSPADGEMIDTGRQKLGSMIGDGVRTGIHTSIYPGRKLGPGTTTLPGEIVRRDKH